VVQVDSVLSMPADPAEQPDPKDIPGQVVAAVQQQQ
jgi:hypothetical protein